MARPDFFLIKNWAKFQHYKDRNPPWIKLHVEILASEDWVTLADASRLLAVVCMVVAARNEGRVPNNPAYIKRIAYLDRMPDLTPLIQCGFLVNPLADASDSKQTQAEFRPETEAYSTEAEKKVEGRKRPSRDNGTRLPDDWTPNERNLSDAEHRGYSRSDIDRIAEHFRDHHTAKGTVSKSWDASWRTWLANEKRFAPKGRVGKPAGTDWDGAASDPQSLGQMAADVRPARHGGRIIDAEFSVAAGPSSGEPRSVSASRKRPETVAEGLRDSERGSRGGAEDVPDHAWSSAGRPAEPCGDADYRHLEMGGQTAFACGHSGDSERGDVAPDTVTVPCADSRPQSSAVDEMPDLPAFLDRRPKRIA